MVAGAATRGHAVGGRSLQNPVQDYERSVVLVVAR
jgi:hypothetical protein